MDVLDNHTYIYQYRRPEVGILEQHAHIHQFKEKAKEAEAQVWNLLSWAENFGTPLFHTMLIETFSSREPLINYVKSISTTIDRKHIEELHSLREMCSRNTNISAAKEYFDQVWTDITGELPEPEIAKNVVTYSNSTGKQYYSDDEMIQILAGTYGVPEKKIDVEIMEENPPSTEKQYYSDNEMKEILAGTF
ncbi:MAG: hypothetical protein WCG98_01500 [bacterium]